MEIAAPTTNSPSSKEMLIELGKFIRGSTGGQNICHEELARCALNLMRTLPVSRSAVLEYMCNLFDEAAHKNLFTQELPFSGGDTDSTNLDDVIEETSEGLLQIIHNNPSPWASVISSWSFDLLGHISVKYAERIHVTQSSSLNQVLQVWMTCKATKQLIHIAMECFAAMVKANPDICVDALLEASVKYTPCFDWVVAHIGSCFPTTIITRVLMSGLKDFCIHGSSMTMEVCSTSDERVSKMASVVGILGHLASKHGQDIRKALIHLFKESLEPEEDHMKMSTVAFLLQLASLSPLLLHILSTDFLTILTADVLNTLHDQFSRWSSDTSDFFSLLSLVVHLVMKSDAGAYRVFNFLLDIASPCDEKRGQCKEAVRSTAVTLLDQLCVDLQRAAYNRRGDAIEIPFLASLSQHTAQITKTLLMSHGHRADWTAQILNYAARYSGEVCAADILCHVLLGSFTPQQLSQFTGMQRQLESSYVKLVAACVARCVDALPSLPLPACHQVLRNLLALVTCESSHAPLDDTSNQCRLSHDLRPHIDGLIPYLTHTDLKVAVTTARLIHAIGLDQSCTSDVVLDLCDALCLLLFSIFTHTDHGAPSAAFVWVSRCISLVSQFTVARNVFVKLLLEMALNTDFAETLGCAAVKHKNTPDSEVSLLRENRKHGLALTLPQSHSCVFHTGIVGDGRRSDVCRSRIPPDIITRNKTYFVHTLLSCAAIPVAEQNKTAPLRPDQSDGGDVKTDAFFYENESGRKLAELLVDMLTPDVLYNSILWPEEECIQLTIERDIHVSRHFEVHPVLWDILEYFSTNQAFVCYLSPVLRSLLATIINHFDSSRHISPSNTSAYVGRASRIVDCLTKGKQLPPPLCLVGDILPHLTQHEISLLLTNIWKYVKENPPKIDNIGKRNDCEPRYKHVIREVLHSNIDKLGLHYSKFFTLISPTTTELA